MEQLRAADVEFSSYIKSATYEEFQVLRHQYEMKLLEEERIRKERSTANEEDEAPKEKKKTAEDIPSKEKKKAFFSREGKKGGNRIKTGENGGKNYETIRGDSIFFSFSELKKPMKSGNVETQIVQSSKVTQRTSYLALGNPVFLVQFQHSKSFITKKVCVSLLCKK